MGYECWRAFPYVFNNLTPVSDRFYTVIYLFIDLG